MGAFNGGAARARSQKVFSAAGAGAFILAVAAMTWAAIGWIALEMAQRANL